MNKINALDNIKVGNIVFFSNTIIPEDKGTTLYSSRSRDLHFITPGMKDKIVEVLEKSILPSNFTPYNDYEESAKKSNRHTITVNEDFGNGDKHSHWLVIENVTEKFLKLESENGYTFTIGFNAISPLIDKIVPDTEATKVLYGKV